MLRSIGLTLMGDMVLGEEWEWSTVSTFNACFAPYATASSQSATGSAWPEVFMRRGVGVVLQQVQNILQERVALPACQPAGKNAFGVCLASLKGAEVEFNYDNNDMEAVREMDKLLGEVLTHMESFLAAIPNKWSLPHVEITLEYQHKLPTARRCTKKDTDVSIALLWDAPVLLKARLATMRLQQFERPGKLDGATLSLLFERTGPSAAPDGGDFLNRLEDCAGTREGRISTLRG